MHNHTNCKIIIVNLYGIYIVNLRAISENDQSIICRETVDQRTLQFD